MKTLVNFSVFSSVLSNCEVEMVEILHAHGLFIHKITRYDGKGLKNLTDHETDKFSKISLTFHCWNFSTNIKSFSTTKNTKQFVSKYDKHYDLLCLETIFNLSFTKKKSRKSLNNY